MSIAMALDVDAVQLLADNPDLLSHARALGLPFSFVVDLIAATDSEIAMRAMGGLNRP